MAAERATLTGEQQVIPKGYRWSDLASPAIEGVRLEEHYRETLRKISLDLFWLRDESLEDSASLVLADLKARAR